MFRILAILTLALFFIVNNTVAEPLTARDIMVKFDERYTGDSAQSDAQLILIDRRDRERVRDIRLYSLDKDNVEKAVSFFLSPTDVEGTAYMNFDYDDARDDDSWLYLPALKQVRRVSSGDKSGSFMGSDFTYSDINGINIDWYDYKLLSDSETVDGAETWLIESTPNPTHADKVAEETGYEKSHIWIRKDNFVQVQSKIWMTRGNRIKYFSATDLQLIDNIWTPMRLQMITTRNNEKEHASVFQFVKTVYNQHSDEALFSTQAMERGAQ